MPVRMKASISEGLKKQLQEYVVEVDDGILTKKGYRVNSWKLLQPVTPESLLEELKSLQAKLESFEITEAEHCSLALNMLQNGFWERNSKQNGKTSNNSGTENPVTPISSERRRSHRVAKTAVDSPGNSEVKTEDHISSTVPSSSKTEPETETRTLRRSQKSSKNSTNEVAQAGNDKTVPETDRKEENGIKILGTLTEKNNQIDSVEASNDDDEDIVKNEDTKYETNDKRRPSRKTSKTSLHKSESESATEDNDICMPSPKFTEDSEKKKNAERSQKRKSDDCRGYSQEKKKRSGNSSEDSDSVCVEEKVEKIVDDVKEEEYEDDEKPGKKVKVEGKSKKQISLKALTSSPKVPVAKCTICHQILNSDLKLYQGHPTDAVDEYIALTDPKLSLFTGDENYVTEYDARPQNKITHFNVYDKEGHLCPFDNGLIEKNVFLYFSGYVKPVYEESSLPDGGIPTKDLGPINEWWVSGFDGGESALVGFTTAYGEYYLMEPSEEYAPFMDSMKEKIFLSKIVIETVADDINTSYEDLLNVLQTAVPPPGLSTLTEDNLLRHAQFVCDQVMSFDSTAFEDEDLLVTSPCVRSLVKLAGVTFGQRKAMRQIERKNFKKIVHDMKWSKATTTPLVKDVFETFFTDQLDKENDKENKGPRRRRCGVCESCQQPDCGTCTACRDMLKFGGTGKSKQACTQRRCPNMAIQEAEDSENEEESNDADEQKDAEKTECSRGSKVRDTKRKVEWIGEPLKSDNWRTFYSGAMVGNEEIHMNDCVLVESKEQSTPFFVGRVVSMWEDKFGGKSFHCWWFVRGTNTVLGETSDPNELFLVDECENCSLSIIFRKATVIYQRTPENWSERGGEEIQDLGTKNDGTIFFFQKRYDSQNARFVDPLPDESLDLKTNEVNRCCVCRHNFIKNKECAIFLEEKLDDVSTEKETCYGCALWKGKEFHPGNCVFLAPGTFKFRKPPNPEMKKSSNDNVDEDLYPEFYRKSSDHIKGSNEETPEPFCVGYINKIFTRSSESNQMNPQNIFLRVNKFYRPENTHKSSVLSQQLDLNLLYWSEEEVTIPFSSVTGKCNVIFSENIYVPVAEWSLNGPLRFYFTQAYDASTHSFMDPPTKATSIGRPSKGKGKGKGKGKSSLKTEEKKGGEKIQDWPTVSRKLRSLDVFAGCGGLSEGLHQSGVAESCWAIEKEEAAAHAFKLNNPKCTVLTEDCNALLKLVMMGKSKNDKGQNLPRKGEVELLCGGPPCQGFSGMNRFNSRQYSLFKNSLIVSFLSYCDYYRPRFFILENVRNFVSFKHNMVLKLTLRCLVKMGYQCTFGILQAGNYGVPQTRRRAIILAAAPGEVLPNFPEPTHVFNPRACQLSVVVDEKKYVSNCEWVTSAPLRTITVRDSMSDLPEIPNGHRKEEMSYEGEPLSHFQRLMRGNQYQPVLRDHICKDMAPIVEARISHIPTASGSDWRDLPNIAVRLSDGTFTNKLIYTHHDKKNGKSSTGALRGVCSCANGKSCHPMDKQYNTLIPWCLPHTGNRHNHWAGLYGRLEWEGFFSTTVTNPEPMGKQGRVLHPEQTRVVSVRECARSQGFPDTYRFFGNILDKHRQIGNAVPPPMGAAIGYEIRKCVAVTDAKLQESSQMQTES